MFKFELNKPVLGKNNQNGNNSKIIITITNKNV